MKKVLLKHYFPITILGLFLLVITSRVVVFSYLEKRTPPAIDGVDFVFLGKNIKNDFSYKNKDGSHCFHRAPFFPFVLAVYFKVFGENENNVKYLNAFLYAFVIVFVFLISLEFMSYKWALAPPVLSALYFSSIKINYLIMSETLASFMIFLFIYLWVKYLKGSKYSYILACSLVLGLSILVKPVLMPFPILFSIVSYYLRKDKKLIFLLVIPYMILAPWTFRNYQLLGRFIPVTSGAGTVLYIGSDPISMGHGTRIIDGESSVDRAKKLAAPYDVFMDWQANYILRKYALENIKNNPGTYLNIFFRKFFRLWGVTPLFYSERKQVIAVSVNGIILLFAVLGVFIVIRKKRLLKEPYLIIIFLFLYYSFFHMLTYAKPRSGLPAFPLLFILGLLFITSVFKADRAA